MASRPARRDPVTGSAGAGREAACPAQGDLGPGLVPALPGLINLAMLLVAAKVFHPGGHVTGTASITQAHAGLASGVSPARILVFSLNVLLLCQFAF